MSYREMHPWFDATFRDYDIPHQIRVGLWNYLAYGIPAGGFCMHVLNNDFIQAMGSADCHWSSQGLKDLAMWITWNAPRASYGSKEKILAWSMLSDEDRRTIMIDCRLRPSVVDILKGTSVA